MLGDGPLTFREFAMGEPLPLARIHDVVLAFLRDRDDTVLVGAQAVNAYVDEPRMTADVDVSSTDADKFARALLQHLAENLHIAVRVRDLGPEIGLRLYQVAKPKNRRLVDVRRVAALPPVRKIQGIRVLAPADLVAQKVLAFHGRQGQPKSFTDRRDLAVLLLAFPELKKAQGEVRARLAEAAAHDDVLATWARIAAEPLTSDDE